jgi:RNA polymerase sigma-70 factor (ECF subfamily)
VASSASALVNAARQHVPEAWDTLLQRHQLPLYTYVAELLRDDTAALDVVQETFAAAVRHIATLRDDTRFASWLFGIAHQKCVQHWRRTQRISKIFASPEDAFDPSSGRGSVPADWPDPDGSDPRALLIRNEQTTAVFALVEKLPPAQRSALLLHVLEDFSLEDIAAISEAPVGTIKSRLHHAKRALRQLVEAAR